MMKPSYEDLERRIDELEKIEQDYKNSLEKYAVLFNHNPDGIVVVDPSNAAIIEFNDQLCKQLGYTREEFKNLRIPDLEVLETEEDTRRRFKKIIDTGFDNFETKQKTKSGEIRDVYVIVQYLQLNDKPVFFCIWRDITESKKNENKLFESQLKLRTVFEYSNDALYLLNMNGFIVETNRQAELNTGLTKHDLTTKPVWEIHHQMLSPELKQHISPNFIKYALLDEFDKLNGDDFVTNDSTIYSATGEIKHVNDIVRPLIIDNTKYLFISQRDITERKKAEEKIRQSERKLKLFVDHAPASIAMFDRDMIYLAASNRYIQDFNLNPQDIIGRSHYDIFPEMGEERIAIHKRCLAGASEKSDEDRLVRMDGSVEYVRWELYPWYENDNKIGGLLFFSEVFTGRKKAQILLEESESNLREKNYEYEKLNKELMELNNQLLLAKDKAEESDRLKTAFLQNISHEIRTPLNGILGFSKLLKLPDLSTEELHEYTNLILNSGDRLLETVNNILDMALIQSNQLVVNKRKFVLNGLISDLFESNLDKAKSKNIELKFECQNEVEDSIVNTDQIRLHQVLNNLINNAIKFTNDGIVEFGYIIVNNYYEFYVKDTGIGIHSQLVDRIFKRFTQVDDSISRNYEGNGLGLSICKGLVELLGGKIWFDSEIGKGTSFYFTIPV